MSYDFVQIRNLQVRHAIARRDWVCGCGSRLRTIWQEQPPGWLTVCAKNPIHDANTFMHVNALAYLKHKNMMELAEAEEVFRHLPPEVQESIIK